MIFRRVLMPLLLTASWVMAEPDPVTPQDKVTEVTEKGPFQLDSVVAPILKNMEPPRVRPNIVGEQLAVSSPSETARKHVMQGFALVHAQWDFEAYRHFCHALQQDPDCLMAYCGVSLALARPHNEYVEFRRMAVDRMLDLMEIDEANIKAGKPARFPAVEKDFAAAVATLVSTSPKTAGAMFHKIGQDYPNFIQAQLLALFLSRGGYDLVGDPTAGQIEAIQRTHGLLKKFPDNPMVIGFWLSLNAAAPRSAIDFEKDLIPYARRLVEMDPDFAPWQHVLGYYSYRVGSFLEAQKSFGRAAELYKSWMKEDGIGVNDCEGFITAMECRGHTLYQSGQFEAAMEVANELRALKLDIKRPRSAGNAMLMWRGYNLKARLLLARADKGDMDKALKSLPGKKELSPFVKHKKYPTLAGVYTEALGIYLGCRKAIEKKDLKSADGLHRNVFRKHIMNMAAVSKGASQVSDYAHFLRAGNCLAIYDKELAGLIALNGPEKTRVVASGRFLSARDKQQLPSMMFAPLVLTPIDNRLGDYYIQAGQYDDALKAYQQGAGRYVNNVESLRGMKESLDLLGRKDEAEKIQQQINLIEDAF